MNFLAHAYLSFNHPGTLVGNMISDFVKGSSKYNYRSEIQKGIMLHRHIDHYTDTHPATHKAKAVFSRVYRLYSGPIMDIIYDHYLATDPAIFAAESLQEFSQQVYRQIEAYRTELPPVFIRVFEYMKRDNWLLHYQEREGIEKSLSNLARRASFMQESHTALRLFDEHYDFLGACYREFFPDVKEFAKQKFDNMLE